MTPGTFIIRYLLLPTTLLLTSLALAWLSSVLAPSCGTHVWAVAMMGAMVVLGLMLGIPERIAPAAGFAQQRTANQRRWDYIYVVATFIGVVVSGRLLMYLADARQGWNWGFSLGSLSLPVQAVIAFFSSEFLMFLLHWACHRSGIDWLWRVHAIHHRPNGLSLLSGSRSHTVDVFFQAGVIVPAILAGVSSGAVTWCLFLQVVIGAFQHVDLDMRMGVFNYLIPGPEVHRVHHHIDPDKALSFSLNAPIFDVIFRTEGPFARAGEIPMGVAGEPD